jgi:lipoprotein-anchoring transpeptidase ErfK/SrfK
MKRSKSTQTVCIVLWLIAASGANVLCGADTSIPARRIVISIPKKQLTLFEGESIVKTYDVAVGKPSTPSPVGSWEIVNRINHPTWYAHGKPVTPGPRNPLGTRWIGLSKSGYGIHGTNEPASIGKAVSHGCIRMRNQDVEALFALVEPGMKVQLIDF